MVNASWALWSTSYSSELEKKTGLDRSFEEEIGGGGERTPGNTLVFCLSAHSYHVEPQAYFAYANKPEQCHLAYCMVIPLWKNR